MNLPTINGTSSTNNQTFYRDRKNPSNTKSIQQTHKLAKDYSIFNDYPEDNLNRFHSDYKMAAIKNRHLQIISENESKRKSNDLKNVK